ncbi:MAG: DUF86 domain-containing protein [Holophagaceae bacterium]|nr:DUF86 domain-containing protein [Holophagaceae bacterium]
MLRDPKLFLQDILDASAKVFSYSNGMTQEEFEANGMAYDAVIRNLEVIGEAAKQIPQELRDASPDIPWRMICGFRDHLAHAYFGLDNDTVWEVVSTELPALVAEAGRLMKSLP